MDTGRGINSYRTQDIHKSHFLARGELGLEKVAPLSFFGVLWPLS
jgi:hypothetical protein